MTPTDRTNPLDLNNLPDDYSRDGKHSFEQGSSSSGYRKKKSGGKDGKDESGKVYECRFCSLKFCKSQALGGHMNRHRQERETETLNRARQLVFNNENLAAHGAPHLGGQAMAQGNFHQTAGNMGDPTLPFRSVYGPRMFPGSSTTLLQQQPPPPPPPQPYLYQSPSRLISYPSQCPPSHSMMNDYYVGHVLNNSSQYGHQPQPNLNFRGAPESNYTCIGAPVGGHGFSQRGGRGLDMGGTGAGGGGGGGGGRDGSLSNQEEGLNWGTGYAGTTQQRLDPSLINRFQDGF